MAAEIIAHRGESHDAPENTLPAIELAWERGADAVEIDVYLSKDGQIIAMHDETTERYTGEKWKPASHTLEEFKSLDFGAWKGPEWENTPIATFSEILATVPDGKRLFVEIKCGPKIVAKLAEEIEKSGKPVESVAFISFSMQVMKKLKKEIPEHKSYWLLDMSKGEAEEWDTLLENAMMAGLDGLDLSADGPYDKNFMRQLSYSGLEAYAWTVNDPELAAGLIDLGFNGITTDRAGWLRENL